MSSLRGSLQSLFSGGKDSLCTLHYVSSIGKRIGAEVTALHVDTTAGFPEVTDYVKEASIELGVPLKILRPEKDFFDMAKEWGIPGVNSRWCCRELKIRPLMEFLSEVEDPKVVFDGIRASESTIRSKYLPVWFHPAFGCLSVSPIIHWSHEDVVSYIEEKKLPTGSHMWLGTSSECWCGAYKSRQDFEKLYRLHPDIYQKLAEVEEANKSGYTFIYEKGERISLKQLESKVLPRPQVE